MTTRPVPKPRACYQRNSLSSAPSSKGDVGSEKHLSNGLHPSADAPPPAAGLNHGAAFPTLTSVTGIISANIPSLAGVLASISGSDPTKDTLTNNTPAPVASLAGAANTIMNPMTTMVNSTSTSTPETAGSCPASLDHMVSSLSTSIPSLADTVSRVANPTDSPHQGGVTSAPPTANGKHKPPSVSKIMEMVNSQTVDILKEDPDIPTLAFWTSQEEADTESTSEEDDPGTKSSHAAADGRKAPPFDVTSQKSTSVDQSEDIEPGYTVMHLCKSDDPTGKAEKAHKQKIPKSATIRVSRKKGGNVCPTPQSAVVRASWLDVWKGFRHSVLWATLDGRLMSLWKKRTDKSSEVLFHVSSVTNVKKQDRARFSIYLGKKHYDFMAHSDEVQDGWVTSLLACRGIPSPTPSQCHGLITIKDPRRRVYAAVWDHDLWIYPNKEGFQLGVASYSVPLNIASVKSTGEHSFTLITPYKTFNLSVASSKELSIWLGNLTSTIQSALSCSQVAQRLWENPSNKVCGDCGEANPEWASVNLLLVICNTCAGHHRHLGSKVSKVRSLMMDSKVWTEPLIQLFITYGNLVANQVWAPAVPAAEQLHPQSSEEDRSTFIQNKYSKGQYRRVHALAPSQTLMNQRLCEVVCGGDVEETMTLLCSGAKVRPSDPQIPSPIHLAESAGQGLQVELLKINEFLEAPPYLPQTTNKKSNSTPSEEKEELHGKLEEDRFLFSSENDSAACDVLDLREVLSVFMKDGQKFEVVTLNDKMICDADSKEALLSHLVHILKVILPGGVSEAEVGRALAVSKVCAVKVGGAPKHSEAWLLLWEGGVSIHPAHRHTEETIRMEAEMLSQHEMHPSENTVTVATGDRSVSARFEDVYSCESWFRTLEKMLANQRAAPPHRPARPRSLYPVLDPGTRGSVPPAVERCISHVTHYGLKVEGVYRRCGLATKVSRLVQVLVTSPISAPLENDEQGVLDAAAALKQLLRQQDSLVPTQDRDQWVQAAVVSDERRRFSAYRELLRHLPADNRATLNAIFGHFYIVQLFSQMNKMTAQNLALVLVPSLFQTLSQDLVLLTKEFIIHHTLLFLSPDEDEAEEITIF
ncbi:arf-GAP with Rho-GAP domain, ANK repeat and PH domain-containing protein 1 [Thalassophryne amazonica]|uniref:arf-GAP with Rho-GAP domain, ANK repeat and PH domain-containing protein 1 n=1 Tax=Thalassophryne amazonica TaxID=390379 RepID=UPI00147264B3|nr:arf-GAP with Rho-GAP domain, ANK repeat and PH domain-containing protein 1 [Thalassophryne amazonica]